MMNIPMKSAKRLEMFTIIEYAAVIASNCWPRLDGGSNLKARTEERRQFALRLRQRAAGLDGEVDPIERAAAAEHLLRGVDVHDRRGCRRRRSRAPTTS